MGGEGIAIVESVVREGDGGDRRNGRWMVARVERINRE